MADMKVTSQKHASGRPGQLVSLLALRFRVDDSWFAPPHRLSATWPAAEDPKSPSANTSGGGFFWTSCSVL